MPKIKKKAKEFSAQNIIGEDYSYYIHYETRGSRSCLKSGCDGICRCYKIDYVKLLPPVNVYNIVGSWFYRKTKPSELFLYCIERLARNCGMDSPDNFDAHISKGYYGQEMDKITFLQEHSLVNKIQLLLSKKTEKEAIEYVLLEEYGHILPKMTNLNYKVVEVDTIAVNFPNKEYLTKLNKDKIKQYEEELTKEHIICVCIKNGNSYNLIDGYHRLAAWKNKGGAKIKIISGE